MRYLAAILLAGCVADTEPPNGARIQCASGRDCPADMECRANVRLCVAHDAEDQRGPELLSYELAPAQLTQGRELVLRFTADEPLGVGPVATLELPSRPAFTRDPAGRDALTHVLRYAVTGDEPEGSSVAVTLGLADVLGNESYQTLGVVSFDFTPPTLASVALDGDPSACGASAVLGFSAEAPIDAVYVGARLVDAEGLTLANVPAAAAVQTEGAVSSLRIAGSADLGALALDGVAAVAVEVDVEDAAGNRAPPASSRTAFVSLDASPPDTVIDGAPPSPTTARQASFDFSGTDAAAFACSLDGEAFTACSSPASYDVTRLEPGPHSFAVRAIDAAGNFDDTPAEHTWTIERFWAQAGGAAAHACAVASDGTAWCWGENGNGQLGRGDRGGTLLPPAPAGDATHWAAISTTQASSTCALTTANRLFCWGPNDEGQLGCNSLAEKDAPTEVSGAHDDWTAVSAGQFLTCGIRAFGGGTLWCWGDLYYSGDPGLSGLRMTRPAQVGEANGWLDVKLGFVNACAIRDDGGARTLWCWSNGAMTQITGTDWVSVSVGVGHTCGIRDDGAARTLWCWGQNGYGQLGLGDTASYPFTTPQPVGSDGDWEEIVARDTTTCGRRGQTVYCWGSNTYGQTGVAAGAPVLERTPLAGVEAAGLWLGSGFACALTVDHRLLCWGNNAWGQLGDDAASSEVPREVPTP